MAKHKSPARMLAQCGFTSMALATLLLPGAAMAQESESRASQCANYGSYADPSGEWIPCAAEDIDAYDSAEDAPTQQANPDTGMTGDSGMDDNSDPDTEYHDDYGTDYEADYGADTDYGADPDTGY